MEERKFPRANPRSQHPFGTAPVTDVDSRMDEPVMEVDEVVVEDPNRAAEIDAGNSRYD